MNTLIPENSYMHHCSCGADFLAPKGSLHCHKCLYATIAALRAQVESANQDRDSWRRVCATLEGQKINLIKSGTKLSNIAYNLKQNVSLQTQIRISLESSQNEWDATVGNSQSPELLESEK